MRLLIHGTDTNGSTKPVISLNKDKGKRKTSIRQPTVAHAGQYTDQKQSSEAFQQRSHMLSGSHSQLEGAKLTLVSDAGRVDLRLASLSPVLFPLSAHDRQCAGTNAAAEV